MSYSITPRYVCIPGGEQWYGAVLDVNGQTLNFGDIPQADSLTYGQVRASGHWHDLMDIPDSSGHYPDDGVVSIRELSVVVRCLLGASRDKAQRLFEAERLRQEDAGPALWLTE